MNCPFCKGRGRTDAGQVDGQVWTVGCENCAQTGDYDTMKLVRAYQLGRAHERGVCAARVMGLEPPGSALGFTTIASAVIDDARRQRHEEALTPDSVERQRIEAKLGDYDRERGRLFDYVASLAAELRERIEAEVPA